ncbi:hypothetical protein J2T60_001840 [Natronospira proteinivora]|uniref:DUF3617 family protein n=1 Tax=Natronospira proteinivora TaxID=1807133 RepID=A0ABT1GAA7_9GAMM|nr:DUF3617 family protein [Natronospira proteinivora]MCP1727840.1 hypothetical protein [Natronospira proteinivora]
MLKANQNVCLTTLLALALSLPMAALAEQPNLEAGLWSFTNTTTMEGGPMEIPEEENTYQECVTEEDLADPDFLLEDMDNCEVSNLDLSSGGMSYSMVCEEPEVGMTVTMDSEASFMGETMSGTMDGKMEGPMGEMTLHVVTEGERIDDC